MYSGIFELYHQGRNFDKAVYIDLLDDIIFSYYTLKKGSKEIEHGVNNLKRLYSTIQTSNQFVQKQKSPIIKPVTFEFKGIVVYRKTNNFNEKLLEQLIIKDEDQILQIRMLRFRFFAVLLKNKLITESKGAGNEEEDNQTFFDELDDFGPGLKYITKFNSKGEISISFDKIKQENGVMKIGKRVFYIQDPQNLPIFIWLQILKWLVEYYSVSGFNKYLRAWHNGDLDEEDLEFMFLDFKIEELENIRSELIGSDAKEFIKNIDFRRGQLIINGDPFLLGNKAIKTSDILKFICEYFETYKGRTRVNTEELQEFLRENKKRFPSLAQQDLIIETLRTGFFRTFESNLLKKYKFNSILVIQIEHLVLIGKE